jgi:hypothetical protein
MYPDLIREGVHLVVHTWGCAFLECLQERFEPGMYADLIGEGVDGVTYTYASIRVFGRAYMGMCLPGMPS